MTSDLEIAFSIVIAALRQTQTLGFAPISDSPYVLGLPSKERFSLFFFLTIRWKYTTDFRATAHTYNLYQN